MRSVKCKVTGEVGQSYEFYKAANGKYYKSKEIYDRYIKDMDFRGKILKIINSDILGIRSNNCVPLIVKLIKESGLSDEDVYNAILNKIEYITEILKDSGESDASKIYAIFTISTKQYMKIVYAGCYEIRNKKTNEVYIGESINLFGRFTKHIGELYQNKHHCQKLQESFNKTCNIDDFTITPLFMFPIASIDKNILKEEVLYLESAFFLLYRSNKENLYNTINPYIALKENSVSLKGYNIDCKNILELLYYDKYRVLPDNIFKPVKEDILKIITISRENETIEHDEISSTDKVQNRINRTNNLLKDNVNLYRLTNILKEFVDENILPSNYDYHIIRIILKQYNLISIDELGHTVATDYALDNDLYYISKVTYKNNSPTFNYYISEKCKNMLRDILKNYGALKTQILLQQ